MSLLINLYSNSYYIKNKSFDNTYNKNNNNIKDKLGNKKLKIKEKLFISFNYIKNKSSNNNCSKKNSNINNKISNKELKLKRKGYLIISTTSKIKV